IGFAAIKRLMLERDAEFSEIPEVLLSFFEHERHESGIHHGSIDGSDPEPGDPSRHRSTLNKRNMVALGVELEMVQGDLGRRVRRAADAAHTDSLPLEV